MQHTGTVLRMMGRQRLLSKAVRSVISPRQIFSHSHLKIDVSLYVEKEAALHPNQIAFKSKLKDHFSLSQLNNISVDDIDKFMALSVNSEDLSTACEMIEAYLGDKDLHILHPKADLDLLNSYTCVCHILGNPKEAILLWNQPQVRDVIHKSSSKQLYLALIIYLDLLQKHGMYNELLEMYRFLADQRPELIRQSRKIALLVMLALYKEGTPESLSQSLLLLGQHQKNKGNQKMVISPALIAYNLGQHAKAYSILQHFGTSASSNLLIQSLEMMALSKAGKLDQALEVLREFLPRRSRRRAADGDPPAKRRVCYAAVEVVVGAAREAGEEVFQETMDIVENIEKHAEVVEESLEELLFRPIESIRKVSRAVDPEDLSSVADDEDEDLT